MRTCPHCVFDYDGAEHDGCPRCAIAREGDQGGGAGGGGGPEEPPADPLPEPGPDIETVAAEPVPGSSRAETEDERVLRTLDALRKDGVFTVVLIGFFAGGKTWFLTRLTHELDEVMGYSVDPQPPRGGAIVDRTNEIEIHRVRRVRKGVTKKDSEVERFAIVDIPGEKLRILLEEDFGAVKSVLAAMDMCDALIVALPSDEVLLSRKVNEEVQRLGSVDKVLTNLAAKSCDVQPHDSATCDSPLCRVARDALAFCRKSGNVEAALKRFDQAPLDLARAREELATEAAKGRPNQVLVKKSRAKISVLETEMEELEKLAPLNRLHRLDEAHDQLSRFAGHLCQLTGLMSMLGKDQRPVDSSYPFDEIKRDEVNNHIDGDQYTLFDKPAFVAMTKADLIRRPDPLTGAIIDTLCDEDLSFGFDIDPLDTVRTYRQGLPSKLRQWFQHTKFDFVTAFDGHDGSAVVRYNLKHFGIEAVFQWIFWAFRWRRRTASEIAALDRAERLRDLRDVLADPVTLDIPERRGAS